MLTEFDETIKTKNEKMHLYSTEKLYLNYSEQINMAWAWFANEIDLWGNSYSLGIACFLRWGKYFTNNFQNDKFHKFNITSIDRFF